MKKKIIVYTLFIGLVVFVGFLGTLATQSGLLDWYPGLQKPFFQPPPQAFPIAWTLLYAAIAVAGAMIYLSEHSKYRNIALAAWGAQLVFNAAWSELFFRHRRPDLALLDILALLVSIAIFCFAARKVDRRAFRLFVPYFIWVAFATLLNEEILRLNPAKVATQSNAIAITFME